jgi:hypothetical protein
MMHRDNGSRCEAVTGVHDPASRKLHLVATKIDDLRFLDRNNEPLGVWFPVEEIAVTFSLQKAVQAKPATGFFTPIGCRNLT